MDQPGDLAVSLLWAVGALVLVGGALFARRIPMGQAAKMALAWIAIFAVGFVAFTFREDFRAMGSRLMAEFSPGEPVIAGETLRIRKGNDGHFWVQATVNGREERFLIDSGASITGLSANAARRAGVEPGEGYPMMLSTANGMVAADRASIETLEVGTIRRADFPVVIAEEFGGTNVLGMNFLSSLSSWSVEGEWLILRP
ncbi:MAG: TIGR02281 family clan AA aspartic protease [Sphingomonadaceae bacterium]|nr:TIGR02281 family clan AA aspartic protease [Sphingomonadaceae bacterium]